MADNFVSSTSITRDNLVSGTFPLVTRKVTILSGQNVTRGTLMGKIDTGGKFVKSLSTNSDGSQYPHSILVRDVDASLGDKEGEIYLSGQFNKEKIIFGAAHTFESTKETLRDLGIYLEEVSKE